MNKIVIREALFEQGVPIVDEYGVTCRAAKTKAEQALQKLSDFHQYMEATEPEYYDCGGTIGVVHKSQCSAAMKRNGKPWKCACGANLYIDGNGAPASKAEPVQEHESREDIAAKEMFEGFSKAWASPVKQEPVAEMFLGGITDGEYGECEVDPYQRVIEALQKRLVKDGNAVRLELYAAPVQLVKQEPVAYCCGFENTHPDGWIDCKIFRDGEFTTPLYAAPVSAPKQEPVAWMSWIDTDQEMNPLHARLSGYEPKAYPKRVPLYTAKVSAKREWVDLTDDEIWDCDVNTANARRVIAAFKEKNK